MVYPSKKYIISLDHLNFGLKTKIATKKKKKNTLLAIDPNIVHNIYVVSRKSNENTNCYFLYSSQSPQYANHMVLMSAVHD